MTKSFYMQRKRFCECQELFELLRVTACFVQTLHASL
jgi:hypothetical protein